MSGRVDTPGFISAGIFAFTLAQNEFLYALIVLTNTDVRTVPVAIICSFFVERYVAGLTSGSVEA